MPKRSLFKNTPAMRSRSSARPVSFSIIEASMTQSSVLLISGGRDPLDNSCPIKIA